MANCNWFYSIEKCNSDVWFSFHDSSWRETSVFECIKQLKMAFNIIRRKKFLNSSLKFVESSHYSRRRRGDQFKLHFCLFSVPSPLVFFTSKKNSFTFQIKCWTCRKSLRRRENRCFPSTSPIKNNVEFIDIFCLKNVMSRCVAFITEAEVKRLDWVVLYHVRLSIRLTDFICSSIRLLIELWVNGNAQMQ